jgi:hypothetical protein
MLMKRVFRQIFIGMRLNLAKLGQRSRRKAMLPMLLSVDDLNLPNGKMLSDIALRPGFVGFSDETEFRARKIGSTVVVRVFVDSSDSRWLTLRVLTLASKEDAASWASRLKERSVNNRTSPSHISHESLEEIFGASEVGAIRGLRFEFVDQSSGSRFFVRATAGFVGNVAFGVRFMAREDSSSWDDVVTVANTQGKRIRKELELRGCVES